MSHPLKHPKARELLKRVAQSFKDPNTFSASNSSLIFVCGGPTSGASMRRHFVDYANANLSHLRIFLAEVAQKDYVQHIEPEFHNVAEFEEIMAELAACVIIFPESPGSFAELGYFSRNEKLRKKLLVVNNENLQGQDSLVALGPIDLIDRHSAFKPTIQLSYSSVPNFDLVKERLNKRIASTKRRRLNAKKYVDLSIQSKFYCVLEIVHVFRALPVDSIEFAFKSIWGNVKRAELHRLLSILVAAEYVKRVGDDMAYFSIPQPTQTFLERNYSPAFISGS